MKKIRQALRFVWTYRLFSSALVAGVVGGILYLINQDSAANWVLGTVAILNTIPLLLGMIDDIRHGTYGIDLLAITAIVFSVILGEYWAAIVLVIMITGGESLEAYAERRANGELEALIKQAPSIAHVVRARKTVDVKATEVRVGETIIIKPGERVPVDAEIIEGIANFDESAITGESLPQSKQLGDQVLSGTVNQDGAVTAKALHTSADSQYEQIVKLVKGAAASQAPFVRLADRYSIPFTVAAFSLGGIVWILSGDAIRFLQVIVVATPCPFILAAPIALVSGMARASKFGIIVKSGSALEKLAEARTIAFDKTGTLTKGELTVTDIKAFGSYKKDDIVAIAASLEQQSNHILAEAVVATAEAKGIKVTKAKHVTEVAGQGLQAKTKDGIVLVGNQTLLTNNNVALPKQFKAADITQTAMFVAVDGMLAGYLLLEDTVRDESKATLERLKQLGVRETMLITGDNQASGRRIAKQLGIGKLYAEALPGEKLQILEAVEGRPIAYVGDGVNDAPSLTAADVGIAIGARGSTAASESADMVILPNDIGRVGVAVAIARRTFRIARQSIFIGIGLSIIMMGFFATGRFSPLTGAILQEFVDVFVIFWALRAHRGTFCLKCQAECTSNRQRHQQVVETIHAKVFDKACYTR